MLWASVAWVGFCSAELAVVETPISKCERSGAPGLLLLQKRSRFARAQSLGMSDREARTRYCLAVVMWLCGLGRCGVCGGAGLWGAPFARAGYVELVRGVVWMGRVGKGVEQAV